MQTVKNLQELRDTLHDEMLEILEHMQNIDPTDSTSIARNQGYYSAFWDIDQILRNSLKYRDDTE